MAIKARGTTGYSQSVVTINDFGLQRRERVSPTGKASVRFTVGISGSPLPHDLDPAMLGRKPAEAMADWLRERVKSIQAAASPATEKQRVHAAAALRRGEDWALKRYAGGRMGLMPPNPTGNLFNDSGRFAKGIIARPVGASGRVGNPNEWVINVPANRLDPSTLHGAVQGVAALQRIYARLVELVPEFGNPGMLVNIPSVRRAIEDSAKAIIGKNGDLRDKLQAARLRTFRTILNTFGALADAAEGSGAGMGGLLPGR